MILFPLIQKKLDTDKITYKTSLFDGLSGRISVIEEELGVKFPQYYVDFLLQYNSLEINGILEFSGVCSLRVSNWLERSPLYGQNRLAYMSFVDTPFQKRELLIIMNEDEAEYSIPIGKKQEKPTIYYSEHGNHLQIYGETFEKSIVKLIEEFEFFFEDDEDLF